MSPNSAKLKLGIVSRSYISHNICDQVVEDIRVKIPHVNHPQPPSTLTSHQAPLQDSRVSLPQHNKLATHTSVSAAASPPTLPPLRHTKYSQLWFFRGGFVLFVRLSSLEEFGGCGAWIGHTCMPLLVEGRRKTEFRQIDQKINHFQAPRAETTINLRTGSILVMLWESPFAGPSLANCLKILNPNAHSDLKPQTTEHNITNHQPPHATRKQFLFCENCFYKGWARLCAFLGKDEPMEEKSWRERHGYRMSIVGLSHGPMQPDRPPCPPAPLQRPRNRCCQLIGWCTVRDLKDGRQPHRAEINHSGVNRDTVGRLDDVLSAAVCCRPGILVRWEFSHCLIVPRSSGGDLRVLAQTYILTCTLRRTSTLLTGSIVERAVNVLVVSNLKPTKYIVPAVLVLACGFMVYNVRVRHLL
ncbi:hypothetical protein C8F01DRAFT_1082251 [Mycena amicta]|nr:hypothetical protein C8F01DRAFT_1082251 [Mycena amicta]